MRRARLLSTAIVAATIIGPTATAADAKPPQPIRFATFNASLNRNAAGLLHTQLTSATSGGPVDPQLATILQIVEINDPDVLLINEFDTGDDGDMQGVTAMFAALAGYEYYFSAPSNTGVPSGFDLNNNGVIGGPDDAYGFLSLIHI